MGLTITGNYKNAIELRGGYSILANIRSIIANAFDKEFSHHYEKLFDIGIDYKEFDQRTIEILKDKRFKQEDEDIIDFLFANDEKGKISYKTCKKIFELIKDDNAERILRYAYYSNNDWQDFKDLLKGCYSHRSNLIWD